MDIYNYVIPGTPIPAHPVTSTTRRFWSEHKQIRLRYRLTLEKQHPTEPITGPLSFDITFYLPIQPTKQSSKLYGQPHARSPTIRALVTYLERVAAGIIFKKGIAIASINAKKLYDKKPRTELTVTTLKG